MLRAFAFAALLALAACAGGRYRDTGVAMETVASVDLARYAGRWHEVARFPVWFQRGCTAVTADYALRSDGRVEVVNACDRDGERVEARAVARSAVPSNARLKVRFARWLPVEGDYWVLYLDADYGTAVVGVPSGAAGWILSRTPEIAPEKLEPASAALAAGGYDLSRLTFDGPSMSIDGEQPANN